jgi:hypothetical protein
MFRKRISGYRGMLWQSGLPLSRTSLIAPMPASSNRQPLSARELLERSRKLRFGKPQIREMSFLKRARVNV